MTHLEQLIAEFYDWNGYLVKRNMKVGKRLKGGWEMELDVVAYHPGLKHLVHIEASLDAHSWERREERYAKKFELGEKYILSEVFTWLPPGTVIERIAVFPSVAGRKTMCGAGLKSIDGFTAEVMAEIRKGKIMAKEAISEQFPLLRTLQLAVMGYYRAPC